MSAKTDLTNVWKNLQELDLRPIRAAAEEEIRIALVGAAGVGKRTLASQLRAGGALDPAHPLALLAAPVLILDLDQAAEAAASNLIILLVDARAVDVSKEQECLTAWRKQGRLVIVFYNKLDLLPAQGAIIPWLETISAPMVYGSALDPSFLAGDFARTIMTALPDKLLALGRRYPLLRVPIANRLINDTCNANAAFSIGSGLAEIIPMLNLPLNVADMFVLTKAQAVLVYKLGLALGLSEDWQYYVAEFGGVIGSGFLWRQVARSLVGLIPVWGVVPKVAVAYSGTYVVGHAVLGWYRTGRHLPREQIAQLSRQAFGKGKEAAKRLVDRLPRLRLGRRAVPRLPKPGRKPKELPVPQERICVQCAVINDIDARFCKNCGAAMFSTEEAPI